MKKMLAWVAMLCLLTVVAIQPAAADTLVHTATYDAWKNAQLISQTGNIVVTDLSGKYLVDGEGNVLSDVYQDITITGNICKTVQDGKNGIIDSRTGQVLVPCEYDYAAALDGTGGHENWLAGYRFLPNGTEEDYDFYNILINAGESTKIYYHIDSTDFYYNGTKVGALPRSEYVNSDYTFVQGNYLFVNSGSAPTKVYGPDFSVKELSYTVLSEYDTHNIHFGTGQEAFTPGCTLTADEVETSVFQQDDTFYDLQGNALFTVQQPYDYYSIVNNEYIKVRLDGKYGMLDVQGNTVIPCVCDEIQASDPFPGGYQAVSQDGRLAFYNAQGEMTCASPYAYDDVSVRGLFGVLKDLSGDTIVISGASGELPRHYADVQIDFASSARCFAAQDAEGKVGVVDLFGNELVPFSDSVRLNDVKISNDGTVVLARNADQQYIVYQIASTDN